MFSSDLIRPAPDGPMRCRSFEWLAIKKDSFLHHSHVTNRNYFRTIFTKNHEFSEKRAGGQPRLHVLMVYSDYK